MKQLTNQNQSKNQRKSEKRREIGEDYLLN